jgi:hypothetical protein
MSADDFDPCQEDLDLPELEDDPGLWEDQDDQDWGAELADL